MPVPVDFSAISATPASNSPAGSETPSQIDDYLRTVFAFLKSIQANSGNGWFSPYSTPASLAAAIAALPVTASGTYTPTITNVSNASSIVASSAQYMRVGSVCTVSGQLTVSATAFGEITLGLSLPIASSMASGRQLSGTAIRYASPGDALIVASIRADATNDRADLRTNATSATGIVLPYHFTYTIA
jgi:hypothetical protein